MPLGLTRKEQWALLGTIGVIVAAVGWRSYQQQPGSDMVYVEGQGYWKRLSSQEAKGAQPADPISKAAASGANTAPAAIQPGVAKAPPAAAASPTPAISAEAPKQPPPVQPFAGQRPLPPFAPAPTPSLAPATIKPPPSSQYLSALATAPLDLNAATEQQLEELPSIGPVKATAIVQLRLRLGRYTSVDQLEQVSGIGPATLAKIRPYVRVAPVR